MKTCQPIRPLQPSDMPEVKAVIEACGLFPPELLDGMTEGYFSGKAQMDFWLTYDDGHPVAGVYFAPERMTDGQSEQGIRHCDSASRRTAIGRERSRVVLVET
jgi:hypothetical protein